MRGAIGVIFDMDGVLIDSAAAHQRAWEQLGTEIGTPFSPERFRSTFGQTNASILPSWLGELSAERFSALDQRKESLYRECVRQGAVRIYARIPQLLREIRAHDARIAIASSGPRANVALLTDSMGATELVDASIAAEDVREGKPHPEVFLQAAERLAIPAVRCAVIEDSVHGIEAARHAGMLAVAVLTSTPRERLATAGADVFLSEVGDIDLEWLLSALAQR